MLTYTFTAFIKDTKAMLIRTFLTIAFFSACLSSNEKKDAVRKNATFEARLDKLSVVEVDSVYTGICRNLERNRKKLTGEFAKANTDDAKENVLVKARKLLLTTLSDSLFICWYGTNWDFNGTTLSPRQGNIACGYFVTTNLLQSGFLINRIFFSTAGFERFD